MSDPRVGEKIGPYRIRAVLGRGGMGTVYRADGPAREGPVALKVLSGAGSLDERNVERFRKEAEVLRSLEHPNIVAALGGLAAEGGRVFYAMELVEGPTLADLLKQLGRLPPAQAVAVMLPVLSALAAAHAQGVVHRDVKPGNVLLARSGVVKLGDFGLARALDATRLTMTGQVVGTPAYLSPEQADGKPADHRSDLYAAGITLYECLAGQPPFQAETPIAMLRMHLDVEPPKIDLAGLPDGLEAAARRALEKKPEARFQTAAAFADAIRIPAIFGPADGPDGRKLVADVLVAEPTAEFPVVAPAPRREDSGREVEPPQPPRRWRRWRLAAITAVAAACAALMIDFAIPSFREKPAGPRVRVYRKHGQPLEGWLESVDAGWIKVRTGRGGSTTLSRRDVAWWEQLDP